MSDRRILEIEKGPFADGDIARYNSSTGQWEHVALTNSDIPDPLQVDVIVGNTSVDTTTLNVSGTSYLNGISNTGTSTSSTSVVTPILNTTAADLDFQISGSQRLKMGTQANAFLGLGSGWATKETGAYLGGVFAAGVTFVDTTWVSVGSITLQPNSAFYGRVYAVATTGSAGDVYGNILDAVIERTGTSNPGTITGAAWLGAQTKNNGTEVEITLAANATQLHVQMRRNTGTPARTYYAACFFSGAIVEV